MIEQFTTALALILSGCTGTLKMPINEYSHISVEASPFSSEFEVSYQLYDALPAPAQARNWTSKIKVEGLGTVYTSEHSGSPAATRIEQGWERLWENGFPNWGTIEHMLTDSDPYAGTAPQPTSSKPQPKTKTKLAPRRSHVLTLAELPPFLFSRSPQW
jgi:hypothetical protein